MQANGSLASSVFNLVGEEALQNSILWDGQPMEFKDDEFKHLDSPEVSVSKLGNSVVTVALPHGLQLRVFQREKYQDCMLTMRQNTKSVKQASLCGNNNGLGDEEFRLGRKKVEDGDNMFLNPSSDTNSNAHDSDADLSNTDNIEDEEAAATGAAQNARPPKIWECKGADRKRAERLCKDKFGASRVDSFLRDCVYDVCFSAAPEDAAKAIVASAHLAQSDSLYQKPRGYSVTAPSTMPEAWDLCKKSGQNLVKITSGSDNQGALEAIVQRDTPAKVWIGAKFNDGKWQWADGQVVEGFTNWDATTNSETPSSTWMCMRRDNGQWTTCTADQTLPALCEDPKHYASVGISDALGSRRLCGRGHQMAMPKSQAEQAALMAARAFRHEPCLLAWRNLAQRQVDVGG